MNIYQRAINKWGQPMQMIMAIEEMAELTKEIVKQLRYDTSNAEEEIADVKIMITQLEEMFDKEKIEDWTKVKLARLEKTLNKLEEKK